MRYISMDQAKPGMIVGKSVFNEEGKILVNYKVCLTEKLIGQMKEKKLQGLYISDELSKDINIEPLVSEELEQRATQVLHDMDIDAVASDITEELSRHGDINVNLVSLRTSSDYTYKHSLNVAILSVLIGIGMGMRQSALKELATAGLLHDIGKIGIPDRILNKPERLTDEEYKEMKSHVVKGGEILKSFTLIDNIEEGALYHHERYDGKGYVHGLKGEEIPLNARIIGIADAFDAMTANRVYRKKLDMDFVLGELKKGRGTQFDPQLTDIMLHLIETGQIDMQRLYDNANVKEEEE